MQNNGYSRRRFVTLSLVDTPEEIGSFSKAASPDWTKKTELVDLSVSVVS